MALVHTFTFRDFLANKAHAPPELAKLAKLCAKATNPAHAKKFIDAFKGFNLTPHARKSTEYLQKHAIGLKLLPEMRTSAEYSKLEKLLQKSLIGPQRAVLLGKVDLSVHLKDGKFELHHTDHKGGKSVLLSVGP